MDIMGPIRKTADSNGVECIHSTDSKVIKLSTSCIHILTLLLLASKVIFLTPQGKEVNLFQPASEFLPMISEVCIYFWI